MSLHVVMFLAEYPDDQYEQALAKADRLTSLSCGVLTDVEFDVLEFKPSKRINSGPLYQGRGPLDESFDETEGAIQERDAIGEDNKGGSA